MKNNILNRAWNWAAGNGRLEERNLRTVDAEQFILATTAALVGTVLATCLGDGSYKAASLLIPAGTAAFFVGMAQLDSYAKARSSDNAVENAARREREDAAVYAAVMGNPQP